MSRPRVALVLAAVVGLPACGAAFSLDPPPNFVTLAEDESPFELRATSADGVVVGVRVIENDPPGTLDFWKQAIRTRLRDVAGYALIEERAVEARSGEPGVQFRMGRDDSGRAYLYWLTLYVGEEDLFVVEAGGRREAFEGLAAELERAIAAFESR